MSDTEGAGGKMGHTAGPELYAGLRARAVAVESLRQKFHAAYNRGENDPATDEYKLVSSAFDIARENFLDTAKPTFILSLLDEHATLTATVERMRGALEAAREAACAMEEFYLVLDSHEKAAKWHGLIVEIDAALSPPPSGEG